jgi:putative SOS response-associated peptidase YedK
LIPADGFYEWKRNGKSKQPYYFQLKDETPFAFAGIWDEWQKEGVSITSCSIVTTTPNELLATIHDRMPVILHPEAQDVWLRNDSELIELKRFLIPFPASAMKSYPVSQQVNHAQAENAQLVEPIDLSEEVTNLTLF